MITRNSGQDQCWEKIGIDVDRAEWRSRQVKVDAQRFEQIYHSTRVRLGLEDKNG